MFDAVKTCPECAEKVKMAAIKCRYCGHQFDLADIPDELPSRTEQITDRGARWARENPERVDDYLVAATSGARWVGHAFVIGVWTLVWMGALAAMHESQAWAVVPMIFGILRYRSKERWAREIDRREAEAQRSQRAADATQDDTDATADSTSASDSVVARGEPCGDLTPLGANGQTQDGVRARSRVALYELRVLSEKGKEAIEPIARYLNDTSTRRILVTLGNDDIVRFEAPIWRWALVFKVNDAIEEANCKQEFAALPRS